MNYSAWMSSFAYVGKGDTEGTVEDALLDFFYRGISPWMKSFGYKWNSFNDDDVARKFLRFCYTVHCSIQTKTHLEIPEPMHRNLYEDRETFDHLIDTQSIIEFLDAWDFRTEIVGTRFEHLLPEFCYVWLDVTYGKPGALTEKCFVEEDNGSEEDNVAIPDGNWNRRKYDLY